MEPQELSDEVERTLREAQDRVGPNSIGAQQYHTEGQPQKFEVIDMETMFEMFKEEALDIINYGVMLNVKIDRMRGAWREHEKILQAYEEAANEVRSDSTAQSVDGSSEKRLLLGPTSFVERL